MHRRPDEKHHGGLWEFPGGKVEPGENPSEALVREIAEELGLGVDVMGLVPAAFAQERTESHDCPIVILLYTYAWDGAELAALEGGAIEWFTPRAIAELDKPPLDVALARNLFEKPLD